MIRLLQLNSYTGDITAPSPNHDDRRAPAIEGIVLHATADDGEEALSITWLRSAKSQVSCHLLVTRAGRVTRLVGDRHRAWHAGLAWWRGTSDVNSITLGIEIANRNDGEPYTDAQYERVAEIVAHYCRQGLSLDDVVSHADIAEGRKTDPLGWDWERFREMVQDQLWPIDFDLVDASTAVRESGVAVGQTPAVAVEAAPVHKQTAPVPPKPKPLLHSRTVWLNAFTVFGAGGMLVGDALDLAHRVGIHPPEDVVKWALFCVGLVNIVLRLRTTRPITCSPNARGSCQDEPQLMMKEEDQQQVRGEAAGAVQSGRRVLAASG